MARVYVVTKTGRRVHLLQQGVCSGKHGGEVTACWIRSGCQPFERTTEDDWGPAHCATCREIADKARHWATISEWIDGRPHERPTTSTQPSLGEAMVQVDKTIEELMALNYHTVLYPHDDIATVIGRLKWVASWMKRGVVESGECDG